MLFRDDAEVIFELCSKARPLFWDDFSKELQNGFGKLFLCGIGAIVGDVLVHHGPKPFN